jgi:hypothetical protein
MLPQTRKANNSEEFEQIFFRRSSRSTYAVFVVGLLEKYDSFESLLCHIQFST